MANTAASTIIGLAWNKLNVDGTTVSEPGLQMNGMLSILTDACNEYRRAFRRGGEPPLFIRKEKGYDLVADTTLSAAQDTSDVTASLTESANFGSSGAIAIWDGNVPDIQEFTSNASDILSGITGNDWDHDAEAPVSLLYALPSNFGSFRATEDSPYGVMVNGVPFKYTSGIPIGQQFAIYDNGTTKYLFLSRGTTGFVFLTYNKNSTVMDDAADLVDWPSEYDYFGVNRLVQHGCFIRNEWNGMVEAKAEANRILYDSLKDRNVGKAVRVYRPRPLRAHNPRLDPSLYRQE